MRAMAAITTEDEFFAELERMHSEVAQCVLLFYQYIEIHNHAAANIEIFKALNRDAEFWNANLYALQQAMFISLGRIFDSSRDAHSIYKLLKAAQDNRKFFFKRALRARRMKWQGKKPDYLDKFIAEAHVPTTVELRKLTKSLKGPGKKYREAFGDIRNLHVGHTIVKEKSSIQQMYGKVVLSDAHDVLFALTDVMFVLRQIWDNGKKPVLGTLNFKSPERIATQTHAALDKLIK
jgi:hypothetical protein